jgi:hypothetical protein
VSRRDRSSGRDATLAAVYLRVEPGSVIETVARLRSRIDQRFPDSGLSRVAAELHDVALESAERARQSAKPEIGLRVGMAVLVVLVLAGLFGALASVKVSAEAANVYELLQGIEAGVNDLVFLGLGIFFLASLEARLKI